MDDFIGGIFGLAFLAAIVSLPLAYSGVFYTTGTTWYEECWQLTSKWRSLADPVPIAPDPYVDAIWKTCAVVATAAAYDRGMIFAGRPKSDTDRNGLRLQEACPSNFNDVPMGGMHYLAVRLIQEQGGPDVFDKFLPAKLSVGRYFRAQWPQCEKVRKEQGYPRVVETSPGKFDWEGECKPCKMD